nr:hypothetical protein GCM10025732_11980 [Glycomyces mayteni]
MAQEHRKDDAPGTVLEAVLERVTYANEETGYTIARASPPAAAPTW